MNLAVMDGLPCYHFSGSVNKDDDGRSRYEVNPDLNSLGSHILYQLSTYVPDQDTDGRTVGLCQWHSYPGVTGNYGVPLQLCYFGNGMFKIVRVGEDGKLVQMGEDGKRHFAFEKKLPEAWHHWIFDIDWNNYIHVYLNDDLVYSFDDRVSFQDKPPYFKYGLHIWDRDCDLSFNFGLKDIGFTN